MNEEKLKRFVYDEVMKTSVYTLLLESFLKKRTDNDIHVLAASRIAVDMLHEAWKELDKYKKNQEEKKQNSGQVGL